MNTQVQMVLPLEARVRKGIVPGECIDFAFVNGKVYISRSETKGKKVSKKGQITIPQKVLNYLNVHRKEELTIFYDEKINEVILMNNQLQNLINKIGPEPFNDRNVFQISMMNGNVFLSSWKEDEVEVSTYKSISQPEVLELIDIIEKIDGLSQKSHFDFIKTTEHYMFIVSYPPTSAEHYITINKLGAEFLPWPQIADLWRRKQPFKVTENQLHYYKEWDQPVSEPCNVNLYKLSKVFNRNSQDIKHVRGFYEGYHTEVLSSIQTLTNGDYVIMYFVKGPVEIRYFPSR